MIEMNADPQPLKHTVSEAPFDPYSVEEISPEQEKLFLASQWRMMWIRFRKHRLAVISAFYHLRLGLQVVIEDYQHDFTRVIAIVLLNFYAIGGAALAIFSILKIAFGGVPA